MEVGYSYLSEQFPVHLQQGHADERTYQIEVPGKFYPVLNDMLRVIESGAFTLGGPVGVLEDLWAEYCGAEWAVGVASGTDALKLALRVVGVEPDYPGHQKTQVVIVPAYTFPSTVNAIIEAGGTPYFVDVEETGVLDWGQAAIAVEETGAVAAMPVWWGGYMAPPINAASCPVPIIEDACQAVGAEWSGHRAGSYGLLGGFSLHPLKNVNVLGDGGVVTGKFDAHESALRVLRNNGIIDRDTWQRPGYNSRLDTLQAVVAIHMLAGVAEVNAQRRSNASVYDTAIRGIPGLSLPPFDTTEKFAHVYHLYQFFVDGGEEVRDVLVNFLNKRGIEAKVHYPKNLWEQPAARNIGGTGDYPNAARFASSSVTLPVHQYLKPEQLDYVTQVLGEFFN